MSARKSIETAVVLYFVYQLIYDYQVSRALRGARDKIREYLP